MNEKFGKTLGDIAGRLHIYQLCSKIGIEAYFYRKVYADKIKEAANFYLVNQQRVQNCINLFCDIQSKDAYQKAILFRTTHQLKDRPKHFSEPMYFNSLTSIYAGGGILRLRRIYR